MADEPVVVLNTQPMKASNGVEDKTEWIADVSSVERIAVKSPIGCEGEKYSLKRMNSAKN